MDEVTNAAIREHEIRTEEWQFSKLAEQLYTWFDRFNEWFFDHELQIPVISFRTTRRKSLGHYVIDRNDFGLKWNININRLYTGLPLFVTLATLLHEMIHQLLEGFGKGKKRGNYHRVGFRTKAISLGIPCNESGVTLAYQDPFLSLLRQYGVDLEGSQNTECLDTEIALKKGLGSKLKKWSCRCTNVRVAIDDFRAKCLKCGNEFKLVF